MRNPNGYGGVSRLPGNRRRPFRARITVGWDTRDGVKRQRFATLGYYETRSDALRALAEYNMSPYDALERRTTLAGAYERWSADYFEKFPSTRRVVKSSFEYCRRIWKVPMCELKTVQLQTVIDGMTGKSRAYQAKVRSLLHMLFNWAMARDILLKDYSQYIQLRAQEVESDRRPFTGEEINALWLLREAPRVPGESLMYRDRRLIDALLLLLYTGMRVGELLGLRRSDINLEERYIDLRGTKTKAARRRIPLHRRIIPVLEDILARSSGEELLMGPQGWALTYSQFKYSWFDKVMRALGLNHTPHDTRHTFISALDTAGVKRPVIKFIAGHSQQDVTDRYTHKDLPELLREIEKLEY